MRKTRKKLLAVLLAFTMLFGSSMTVLAAEYEWKDIEEGKELQNGDSIVVTKESINNDLYGGGGWVYFYVNGNSVTNPAWNFYAISNTSFKLIYLVSVAQNKVWKVTGTDSRVEDPYSTPDSYFYINGEEADPTPQTPSTNPTPSSDSKEPTKIEPAHAHSLSWVETVEPSETTDGLMEYKCSCGYVEERSVISGSMAFVKNLVRQIETAPENGTVEIKTEYYTCYTAYIMDALKKRPDVSLKTTYKDYDKDGSIKTFTIPAGKAPDDKELFYGFTYLGNLYGWDE